MFTITGTLKSGGEASITWDQGHVSGPGAIYAEAMAVATAEEGVRIEGSPTGPFWHDRYLRKPLSALCFLVELFQPGYSVTGKVPQLPRVPKGAIA